MSTWKVRMFRRLPISGQRWLVKRKLARLARNVNVHPAGPYSRVWTPDAPSAGKTAGGDRSAPTVETGPGPDGVPPTRSSL